MLTTAARTGDPGRAHQLRATHRPLARLWLLEPTVARATSAHRHARTPRPASRRGGSAGRVRFQLSSDTGLRCRFEPAGGCRCGRSERSGRRVRRPVGGGPRNDRRRRGPHGQATHPRCGVTEVDRCGTPFPAPRPSRPRREPPPVRTIPQSSTGASRITSRIATTTALRMLWATRRVRSNRAVCRCDGTRPPCTRGPSRRSATRSIPSCADSISRRRGSEDANGEEPTPRTQPTVSRLAFAQQQPLLGQERRTSPHLPHTIVVRPGGETGRAPDISRTPGLLRSC